MIKDTRLEDDKILVDEDIPGIVTKHTGGLGPKFFDYL